MRWGILVAAVLLLSLPPLAVGQSSNAPAPPPPAEQPFTAHNPAGPVPTTLYFHLLDALQDFPMNTQEPEGDPSLEGSGLAANSLTCVGAAAPAGGLTQQEYATSYGYFSPGFLDYNRSENGHPRLHPERGLGADLRIDANHSLDLRWFVAARSAPQPVPGLPAPSEPLLVPRAMLRATLREGERLDVGNAGYNTGKLVARGQTPDVLLARQATQGAAYEAVGDLDVYAFQIPLKLESPTVSKREGFSLRIDLFLDVPGCQDPDAGYLMPSGFLPYSDATHRPRLELAAHDPLRVAAVMLRIGQDRVFRATVEDPWGSDDVDLAGARLRVQGPGVDAELPSVAVVRSEHDANARLFPAQAAWLWNASAESAAAGTYTATLTVGNHQGSANATATLAFQVEGKGAPGPGLAMVTGLLGAAAWAARRRR
jgi:hypothetical protein